MISETKKTTRNVHLKSFALSTDDPARILEKDANKGASVSSLLDEGAEVQLGCRQVCLLSQIGSQKVLPCPGARCPLLVGEMMIWIFDLTTTACCCPWNCMHRFKMLRMCKYMHNDMHLHICLYIYIYVHDLENTICIMKCTWSGRKRNGRYIRPYSYVCIYIYHITCSLIAFCRYWASYCMLVYRLFVPEGIDIVDEWIDRRRDR